MCGIVGIIHFTGKPAERSVLERMNKAIAHRGPDGEGFYLNDNVGLAHRRLAVIDLSPTAGQPMTRNEITITFNGEIYNYRELREDLERKGYQFQTNSDTEVILASYEYWGINCVSRFVGMWSFALYDRHKKSIWLSRDRFGKKPLYYLQTADSFYFFSEIKAALEIPGFRATANREVLGAFLVWGETEVGDASFFGGIKKLPAAHNLHISLETHASTISQYYSLKQAAADFASPGDAATIIRDALQQSVTLRLRSDVPVAISLSGGLDSASIAALAVKEAGNLTAFTAGSLDSHNDETAKAATLAKWLGIQAEQATPTALDFQNIFWKTVFDQEEPFDTSSVLMQQYVMQMAHNQNIKVLLGGQGADEVLLGYLPHFWAWLQYQPAAARRESWRLFEKNAALSAAERIKLQWYFANPRVKGLRNIARWLGKLKDNGVLDWKKTADCRISQALAHGFDSYMDYQIFHHGLPKLLRYEDKNSMGNSLETQMPFMDQNLVEKVCSTPLSWRMQGGWTKYLLRLSIEGHLPDEVVWQRRKIGFAAPEKIWLDQTDFADDLIIQSPLLNSLLKKTTPLPRNHNIYWRQLSIAAWEKAFNVGE